MDSVSGLVFGLRIEDVQAIQKVFAQYPKIEKVLIYGSRAKGNFKNGSDIDLTIVAPMMNLTELFAIDNELDDLDLPYKIDLSICHQIENPNLVDHINRVGKVFYSSG